MATNMMTPKQFEEKVVAKANEYLENSDECKQIRAKPIGGLMFGDDPLHFGINQGDKLKSEHLQALILYTDWTDLCTLFSPSLRKDDTCDSLEEVKAKNSKFYHWS